MGQLNDRLAHIKQQLNEAAASWYYRVLSNIHGPDEATKMTYPELDGRDGPRTEGRQKRDDRRRHAQRVCAYIHMLAYLCRNRIRCFWQGVVCRRRELLPARPRVR